MIRMPGTSFPGPPAPLTAAERELRDSLRRDVSHLSVNIGERNVLRAYGGLLAARRYIEDSLDAAGLATTAQEFETDRRVVANIEATIDAGSDDADIDGGGDERDRDGLRRNEILIIGAHYDTTRGGPGANDNGSGVAAALALARRFAAHQREKHQDQQPPAIENHRRQTAARTIRFVFFTNEEGPYFKTDLMGSRVYARACRARNENIIGMINIDTIGCFLDAPGSQKYPPPFGIGRPTRGDFIGFIGHFGSVRLTRRLIGAFRRVARVASEGMILPGTVPYSGFSDQWSFWMEGYPGVLITDTGPFRHPEYHTPRDLPETMDFDRLTKVVSGLISVAESTVLGRV